MSDSCITISSSSSLSPTPSLTTSTNKGLRLQINNRIQCWMNGTTSSPITRSAPSSDIDDAIISDSDNETVHNILIRCDFDKTTPPPPSPPLRPASAPTEVSVPKPRPQSASPRTNGVKSRASRIPRRRNTVQNGNSTSDIATRRSKRLLARRQETTRANSPETKSNDLLPLPPKRHYDTWCDFECTEMLQNILAEFGEKMLVADEHQPENGVNEQALRSFYTDHDYTTAINTDVIETIAIEEDRQTVTISLHSNCDIAERRYLQDGLQSRRLIDDHVDRPHPIHIKPSAGDVLHVFYLEQNLIIVQQMIVSFWTQSALGNIMGAQGMWIPDGDVQRLALSCKYVQKSAKEVIFATEHSIAYVELWTNEHPSEKREMPLTDVFVSIYFWHQRHTNQADRKLLQLENIKGYPDDVRFMVTRFAPKVIVSWVTSTTGNEKKLTHIRAYHLAVDYQTVVNVTTIETVELLITSLHNIEDCYDAIMGYADGFIVLWNIDRGFVIASIRLNDNISKPLNTLWIKSDRGFMFIIQENSLSHELNLLAINGIRRSSKKLQTCMPRDGFYSIKHAFVENGILIAFYNEGILCWRVESGEAIIEEKALKCRYIPSDKHIIIIADEQVIVRQTIVHLINF